MNTTQQPTATATRTAHPKQPAWQRGMAIGPAFGLPLLTFIPMLNQLGTDPFVVAMSTTVAALGLSALAGFGVTKTIERREARDAATAG